MEEQGLIHGIPDFTECKVGVCIDGFMCYVGPQKIDLLFLRHFFEKTNARGRNFFLLCQIFFSSFSVDSNVKDCVISYTLPLITTFFENRNM